MSKQPDYYTDKTIASWDEAAPKHNEINSSLTDDVRNQSFNNLNRDFNALIDSYGIRNKSVVQICCNNGIDLLSLRNKGATRCLGIDGSQAFIEQAKILAASAGQSDIEFLCSDIYKLSDTYNASFDIVVVTVGVLGWMPDVSRFMDICSSLLVTGGKLIIEDSHPILGMYEEGDPSYSKHSYFNSEPFRDTDGLDYFTHEKYEALENFWFQHTLADILMSAITSNLQLEHVKELNYNISNDCADLEFVENNPPLGINLAWKKVD